MSRQSWRRLSAVGSTVPGDPVEVARTDIVVHCPGCDYYLQMEIYVAHH